MIRIRNSEIAKFLRCKRSWYLEYYKDKEPKAGLRSTPATYDVGTGVHVGLHAYYDNRDVSGALTDHIEGVVSQFTEATDHGEWDKAFRQMRAMCYAYEGWVAQDGLDINETTVSLETELTYDIPELDCQVFGTPDHLKEWRGFLIVEDWKTGDIGRVFQMENDWQLLNYGLMAAQKFPDLPLVYARHRRLNRSLHTARVTKPQFAEHRVSFDKDRLDVHKRHLDTVCSEIISYRMMLDSGLDPVNLCTPNRMPMSCNWDCAFKDVCAVMDDGTDSWQELLSENFIPRRTDEA